MQSYQFLKLGVFLHKHFRAEGTIPDLSAQYVGGRRLTVNDVQLNKPPDLDYRYNLKNQLTCRYEKPERIYVQAAQIKINFENSCLKMESIS